MTVSQGFRFSVGGWIKLNIDQFVCAERHQAGILYLALGMRLPVQWVGRSMHWHCVEPEGLLKRLQQA